MNVIIAGGRKFSQKNLLYNVCDYLLQNLDDITIISGTASGADSFAIDYAKDRGYKLIEKPAPWNDIKGKPPKEIRWNSRGEKYWIRAGEFRNIEMAEIGNILILFWDGKSKGSRNMLQEADKRGLKIRIIKY